MTEKTYSLAEVKREALKDPEVRAEYEALEDETMKIPDEFSFHEILHAAHIANNLFHEEVREHIAYEHLAPDVQEKIDAAVNALYAAYSAIGLATSELKQ